jgi:hypothetical protein
MLISILIEVENVNNATFIMALALALGDEIFVRPTTLTGVGLRKQ